MREPLNVEVGHVPDTAKTSAHRAIGLKQAATSYLGRGKMTDGVKSDTENLRHDLSSDSLIVTQKAAPFVVHLIDGKGDCDVRILDGAEGLVCGVAKGILLSLRMRRN